MRPLRKHIRELSGTTGPYTIKARVIDITNVRSATPGSPLEYQEITFQDDEGTIMKTYLFNESLEAFEDIMQEGNEYDIANARVEPIRTDTSGSSGNQIYEIDFNIDTIIQRVPELEVPNMPNYVLIGTIPRIVSLDVRYDVLGVLIYVDRRCNNINYNCRTSDACEVVIVDHSHQQVMMITAWTDLAIQECAALHSVAATFPVVGFKALMPSYQKGFSLITTHASFIILNPQVEKADSLKTWAKENEHMLNAKRQQIFECRHPTLTRKITTIENLLQKNAYNTLQEESHWLHVKLNNFSKYDVHLYLGCSFCGTSSGQPKGSVYTCASCLTANVISIPRMRTTFEAADASGKYTLTTATTNSEKLVQMEASNLYDMTVQERGNYLEYIEDKILKTHLYVQVIPTTALSRTQKLEWVLQQFFIHIALFGGQNRTVFILYYSA
ncbi:replication protein A 70 kDa DNA-binding subunit D-like [Silene latifolia]|uniref:replication protein A 70 kDa DNA-binding subunit D-like n=1 Tax=Silene latifolia TaxID=37657 RepID=UPI003D778BA2